MNRNATALGCVAMLAMLAMLGACADPVVDDRIDALGGEVDGVGPGPTHRPGQPCLACHSDDGGGQGPTMSVAGTVYQKRNRDIPAWGAVVRVSDAAGGHFETRANCAGNFYITTSDWDPVFPLGVEVDDTELPEPVPMESHIGREGACAGCHVVTAGPTSPGRVYLFDDPSVADWADPGPRCGEGN